MQLNESNYPILAIHDDFKQLATIEHMRIPNGY